MDKHSIDKELIRYILVFALLPGAVGGIVVAIVSALAFGWGMESYWPQI